MARRFNIGDRVVRFNPNLYGNLFHKEKYVDYGVVTDANDDRFTTTGKLQGEGTYKITLSKGLDK